MKDSLEKLVATITKHSSKHDSTSWSSFESPKGRQFTPVRLMLYFDESHDLLDKRTLDVDVQDHNAPDTASEQRSAYQILCRTFSTCTNQDLFVVYLSTNSSLSQYSPYHEQIWSYRSPAGDIKPDDMQPPIVELPFDAFAKVKEGDVKLEQVSEPGHMVQFGRPL
jgi:hypothetical protein